MTLLRQRRVGLAGRHIVNDDHADALPLKVN